MKICFVFDKMSIYPIHIRNLVGSKGLIFNYRELKSFEDNSKILFLLCVLLPLAVSKDSQSALYSSINRHYILIEKLGLKLK